MRLIIAKRMSDKIRFYLSKVKTEWSGVAFYSVTEWEATGFPKTVKLVEFRVLDIGTSVTTEWTAETFAKVHTEMLQEEERGALIEECYIGLIHSHNTMSTHFSGTDIENLKLFADPEGFYFSLIVSLDAGNPRSFAVSWVDQYKYSHHVISTDYVEEQFTIVEEEWKKDLLTCKEKARLAELTRKQSFRQLQNRDRGGYVKGRYPQLSKSPYNNESYFNNYEDDYVDTYEDLDSEDDLSDQLNIPSFTENYSGIPRR